ncbi:MAG: hypothetical protein EOO09_12425 [Chitinophagaceae bacterium]|nr:MAG: hypothetical protein EOO09_12425 [Chitinophagaceae bacterium]
MRFTLSLFFLLISAVGISQHSRDQRIEDSVIGWWGNNRFDKSLKPATDPVQVKRIAILDKLVEWMKKSYTPVGGLGTFTRENRKTMFGVRFGVWGVDYGPEWLDEKGQFKPVAEEITPFGIHFNTVPASYAVPFLNGNGASYFVWPKDGFRLGRSATSRDAIDPRPFSPNQSKYITRSNESQIVLLAPDNKLPFIQLTRREYLDLSEVALKKEGAAEMARGLATIDKLRKAYAGKLEQPAETRYMQPTLWNFKNESDDLFDTREYAYPVYKITAEVLQACQTAQPQWIAVWYPYHGSESGNSLYEMNRSLLENINYDYLYDYFFNPAKVNGASYKPADEAGLQTRLTAYRNKYKGSGTTQKAVAKTANVLFADDFASAGIGSKPTGWYIRSTGKASAVTTLKGQAGKWLKLGLNNPVNPVDIAWPLPANFKLEFDLATGDAFTARSGGTVILRFSTTKINTQGDDVLSPDRQWMEFKFAAGLDEALRSGSNYRGVVKAEMHRPGSVNTENHVEGIFFEGVLSQFTDKKTTMHVSLQMKSGVCLISIDGKPFVNSADFKLKYGSKAVMGGLPASTRFNSFRWIAGSEDGNDVGTYISNVLLVKE